MMHVWEGRYRSLFEHSLTGNYVATPGGDLLLANRCLALMLGYESADALLAQNFAMLWVDQAERVHVVNRLRHHGRLEREVIRLRHRDSRTIHLIANFAGVFENRELVEVHGQLLDDTERQALEQQLRHSQKLEAIGSLAGGIAHDFNNLLMPILGYAEILGPQLERDPQQQSAIAEIRKAAEQAASLTRQLLAFGRRQLLQPRPVDVNQILRSQQNLLARTIGEDVELVYRTEAGLWPTLIDPGQVEQVLLNLAANARDAMPDGGTLTFTTTNVMVEADCGWEHVRVVPGPYVRLSITDTGIGMSDEIRARAFEPFFTTKQKKGTGLGLASVYGIVKQNKGYVWVRSTPGDGTTFELYFPRTEHAATPLAASEPPSPRPPGGTETILLVEDMPIVRDVTANILTGAGYHVLCAPSPAEAIELSRSRVGRIDLLLSDIVLPGMRGDELSRRLVAERPDLRTLFMTGHAEDGPQLHGRIDGNALLLTKPFKPSVLLDRVRGLLDAEVSSRVA